MKTRRDFLKLLGTLGMVGITNIYLPSVQKNNWADLVDLLLPYGKDLGAAVNAGGLEEYSKFVNDQFTSITADNEMKMSVVNPRPMEFNFTHADTILAFAHENFLKVHGHTFVWHKFLPPWVEQLPSQQDVRMATEEFIRTSLAYYAESYPGVINSWDVVNEAVDENGKERITVFGDGYIEWALDLVKRLYNGQVFINDYVHTPAWQETVLGLAQKGLIDGVGMQFHLPYNAVLDLPGLYEFAQKLLRHRVALRATEVDVYIPMNATGQQQEQQHKVWQDIAMFVKNTHCDTLTFWGVTDKDSWIPYAQPGYGSALLWDENYLPKATYWTVYKTFAA